MYGLKFGSSNDRSHTNLCTNGMGLLYLSAENADENSYTSTCPASRVREPTRNTGGKSLPLCLHCRDHGPTGHGHWACARHLHEVKCSFLNISWTDGYHATFLVVLQTIPKLHSIADAEDQDGPGDGVLGGADPPISADYSWMWKTMWRRRGGRRC